MESANFLNSHFSEVKRSQGIIFMRLWKTALIGKNKAQTDSKALSFTAVDYPMLIWEIWERGTKILRKINKV